MSLVNEVIIAVRCGLNTVPVPRQIVPAKNESENITSNEKQDPAKETTKMVVYYNPFKINIPSRP